MLVLREYKENETDDLKELLLEEKIVDLELDGIVYVFIENDNLIGAAKAINEYDKWILKYLVIRENNRGENLGDSLLRAILNNIFNQGIKEVYFMSENPYLVSKGFILLNDNEIVIELDGFFNKGCNCYGGFNEL